MWLFCLCLCVPISTPPSQSLHQLAFFSSLGLNELELELIQSHMGAQKPMLRGEVGCACVAREVSVERGGMHQAAPDANFRGKQSAQWNLKRKSNSLLLCSKLAKTRFIE